MIALDRGHEGVAGRGGVQLHLAVLAADGDQHLLAGRLLGLDRGLELLLALDSRALAPRAEREADVARGGRGRFAEGQVDDVPAVGDVGEPGVAGAVGEACVEVADERVRREVRGPGPGGRPGRGRRGRCSPGRRPPRSRAAVTAASAAGNSRERRWRPSGVRAAGLGRGERRRMGLLLGSTAAAEGARGSRGRGRPAGWGRSGRRGAAPPDRQQTGLDQQSQWSVPDLREGAARRTGALNRTSSRATWGRPTDRPPGRTRTPSRSAAPAGPPARGPAGRRARPVGRPSSCGTGTR